MSISPPIPLSGGSPEWTRFFHVDEPSEPAPVRKPAVVSPDGVLSPGKVFAEQWEVRKELGAGGMARVYKVSSLLARQDYAMKVLYKLSAKDPTAVARFQHEFCTLKRLSHPHIVKADTFVAARGEDPCLYTMEFLEGEPLDKIAKNGPLPVERAVQITLQICDAVVALHDLGVLHRDIKPGNIIVGQIDGKDHATLVDLGVCKWTPRYYAELNDRTPPDLRTETRAETVLGTPGYMGASDEDSDGEFRDVFGLGATLYRIVTGRMPYRGEPAPNDVLEWGDGPELPETLIEALEGALAARPRSRYQSVAEFREALILVVDQLALEAALPSTDAPPVERTQWRRRSLVFLGIGIGLVFGLGIGTCVGVSVGLHTKDTGPDLGSGPGVSEGLQTKDTASGGPDVGRVATDEHEPAAGSFEVTSPPIDGELHLSNGASCVPPNSAAAAFVDLQLDEHGRLADVQPGEGVGVLTVLCLKKNLGGRRLWPGGQSTHRVLLSSLQWSEGEHDDD